MLDLESVYLVNDEKPVFGINYVLNFADCTFESPVKDNEVYNIISIFKQTICLI